MILLKWLQPHDLPQAKYDSINFSYECKSWTWFTNIIYYLLVSSSKLALSSLLSLSNWVTLNQELLSRSCSINNLTYLSTKFAWKPLGTACSFDVVFCSSKFEMRSSFWFYSDFSIFSLSCSSFSIFSTSFMKMTFFVTKMLKSVAIINFITTLDLIFLESPFFLPHVNLFWLILFSLFAHKAQVSWVTTCGSGDNLKWLINLWIITLDVQNLSQNLVQMRWGSSGGSPSP